MSKVERLLNLTALLLDTERPLTVERIGELMEGYPEDPASFRRTFERDKEDLREMGVPLEVVAIDALDASEMGYRIDRDRYYAPDFGLTADEIAALRLAAAAIRLDGADTAEALRTLGTAPARGSDTLLAALDMPATLPPVFAALTEHRVMRFDYRGEARELEPARLEHQRGRWYVTGIDRARGEARCFRLDRIHGDVTLGEQDSFQPPAATPAARLEPWQFGDDPDVTARVSIDADRVDIGRDLFGAAANWEERPDGSCIVELAVTNWSAFENRLLDLLDHAELLDPAPLREHFVERIHTTLAGHGAVGDGPA